MSSFIRLIMKKITLIAAVLFISACASTKHYKSLENQNFSLKVTSLKKSLFHSEVAYLHLSKKKDDCGYDYMGVVIAKEKEGLIKFGVPTDINLYMSLILEKANTTIKYSFILTPKANYNYQIETVFKGEQYARRITRQLNGNAKKEKVVVMPWFNNC